MNQQDAIELKVTISEEDADEELLDKKTVTLMRRLRDFDLVSISRPQTDSPPPGTRGDPLTIGALMLVVTPAILPSIIDFLSTYVSERGRIEVEADGKKISFVPPSGKKYTEEMILELVGKLTDISSDK